MSAEYALPGGNTAQNYGPASQYAQGTFALDPQTGNPLPVNTTLGLLTLTAASASGAGGDQVNPSARGVQIGVNITAISGAGASLTVIVEGLDLASGQHYTLLSSAALTATGFTLLTVYPGAAVVANSSASTPLPRGWRVSYVIAGTTPSVTATVGASLVI